MDFTPFDTRGYPVVSPQTGYGEWADDYEATVAAGLDRPLLQALKTVEWSSIRAAADLACGTGRTGVWLSEHSIGPIDGVDITPEMLRVAQRKGVYRDLVLADVSATNFSSCNYDLCTLVLADEHLSELGPVYREAARLLTESRCFVVIGYHPFFLMNGLPTHYHRADGTPTTIQSYVHLFSEHYEAARGAGFDLIEFQERVIDEDWLRGKPKWRRFLYWPVSFALVWSKR